MPVASSPIGAEQYSRRRFRLSPSIANRLTIGFAIAFAVLTALAVVGVARFLEQRQDFEDATARSYQVEIAARNHVLQLQGHHSAQEFARTLGAQLERNRKTTSR